MLRKPLIIVSLSTLGFAVASGGGCSSSGTDGGAESGSSTATVSSGASGGSGSASASGSASGAVSSTGSPVRGSGSTSGSVAHPASGSGTSGLSNGTGSTGAVSGASGHASSGQGASGGASSGASSDVCSNPNLVWKTGNKTTYESYPAPGSAECVQFNGCAYEGQFECCPDVTETLQWVMTHNIVSLFPLGTYPLHDLCLKSGDNTIVATVLDTCSNADCGGCCSQNLGSADALIDVEEYTDLRWGVNDGPIMWADLGITKGSGCN